MAEAKRKPWMAIPGGDGGVILYTVRSAWPTLAVSDWTNITSNMTRPTLVTDRDLGGNADWIKWVLTGREALDLARDLVGRQAAVAKFGQGRFHRMLGEDVFRASRFGVIKGGIDGLTDMAKPVLYFIHAKGCDACAEMRPVVGAFWRANKNRLRVVPVDITQVEWRAKGWEPDATPTCIVRYPDGRLSPPLEGYEPNEWKRWIAKVLR